MQVIDLIKISIAELRTHLIRSTLAVISVVVGISTFISIISLNEGLNHKLLESVKRIGGYDVFEITRNNKNWINNNGKIS